MSAKFLFSLFLSLFTLSSIACADQQKSLSLDELNRFIDDTPVFIDKVKDKDMDRALIDLFLHPQEVDGNPLLCEILTTLSWDPQRYAHIFSYVIIGGFIRDMGEFGDDKLNFLKDQRDKWQASDTPEPEKSKTVADLNRSINDLEEIVARTKEIPKTDLLLMWSKRNDLNEVLMGQLPIGKKRMKVLQ